MTPEEKAVIEAAFAWKMSTSGADQADAETALWRALEALEALEPAGSVWIETTMRQALTGDRIRIGLEEAEVIRCSSGIWQASVSDAWHPQGWEHVEFRAELSTVPGFVQYPPNASIEILCTPERKAILLLQDAFPGSAVS